jgi:hypothetical protein
MREPVALPKETDPRLVRLTPERVRARSWRRPAGDDVERCAKCGSTFIVREPALIHCRYCGRTARIENGSLSDQELYEIRSGLRLAS